MSARARLPVLGTPIDAIAAPQVVARLVGWGRRREPRTVCLCNVHSVVTAMRDPSLAAALHGADLALPDGAPVAWMLRRLGAAGQRRVSGPDLMEAGCAALAGAGVPVFLLGSTPATLDALAARLQARWPSLRIAGTHAPPFRPLAPAEEDALVARLNDSGAGVVWVGLGCPKQERWMAAQGARVQAVLVGVGAAFDFHAGVQARAPRWMREHGLEWLHRLVREPRRLARRYLVTNSLFLWAAAAQLLRRR